MLQLGWESRVGSNYVCLVLLRILAAACSTFGPKGPRVERDRSFGFHRNPKHIWLLSEASINISIRKLEPVYDTYTIVCRPS